MGEELIIAQIINPSDPYTIRGTLRGVRVACLLLGDGKYGLRTEEGEAVLPIFLLGGYEDWAKEQAFDLEGLLRDQRAEVIAALRNVWIGDFGARREAESAVAKMSEPDAEKWLAERHEARRSSANNIGHWAAAWAAHLEETA